VNCPICEKPADNGEGVADDHRGAAVRPRPGNLTVCAHCGGLLRFAGKKRELHLARVTEPELEKAIAAGEIGAMELIAIRTAQQAVIKRGPLTKPSVFS
jgi:hypothetical protein